MAEDKNLIPNEELHGLPKQAHVALTARSALRVFPLFERWNLKIGGGYSNAVVGAIKIAFDFSEGRVASAASAASAAGDADAVRGAAFATTFIAADAADAAFAAAAAAAAYAAAKAADTTFTADAANAAAAAYDAAGYAAGYAADTDTDTARLIARQTMAAAIRSDLLEVKRRLAQIGLGEDFSLDPHSLGPLWREKPPAWYWESGVLAELLPKSLSIAVAPTEEFTPALELYFEPGSATKESLQQVLIALSRLHLAAGGSGLKFEPGDGFIHVRERVEA